MSDSLMLVRCGFAVLVAALIPSCSIISDDDEVICEGGKCDAGETCTDPRYGDGVCHTDLACVEPDLDCFLTFETDEEAATWFGEFETKLAAEEGREPRTLLPSSDPRFVQTRELLDRGWEAFRSNRPVGKLRFARPALVLVEDETVNAFVAPDLESGRAGLAVMVQTGLVALNGTEDATLGVMMHEFQHAVGLHVVGDTKARLRRFYVAPEASEPIGKDTVEDARARDAGTTWRAAADEVGYFNNAELGGLPIAGQIDQIFKIVFQRGLELDEAACARSRDLVNQLRTDLLSSIDPIDSALTADLSGFAVRIETTLRALRDECLAGVDVTFPEVVAGLAGVTPDVIEAQMTAEDKALIANKHIVDAIAALTADRRTKMRAIEAAFATDSGRPWSALRYFSTEEDADDVSVPVLRAAGLDPAGNGDFLLSVLQGEANTRCTQLLDYGDVPPYGVDLADEHHGTCWRVHHVRALADKTARSAAPRAIPSNPVAAPARLPIPVRLRDRLAY
jgi:hypothetical protein